MLKISMILRGLLVDTRLLVGRMFESVENTMVLLQQESVNAMVLARHKGP